MENAPDEKVFFVGTKWLADAFERSERYIQKLVEHGVLEPCGSGRKLVFDLRTVVPQYATFLMSGEALTSWCKDV